MPTMHFVYFNFWQIKKKKPENFETSLIGFGKDGEKNQIASTSPFVFSIVNERTILRILKLIACDNGKMAPTPGWWTNATKPPTQTSTSSSALRPPTGWKLSTCDIFLLRFYLSKRTL